jgi:UDP-N-acetylglucosamine acyltransferase
MDIHPTAIVADGARLGDGVSIGPYCIVGAHVELGVGVVLFSHVVVEGWTKIGAGSSVYPFAVLGHHPQDMKFGGEESRLVIGDRCTVREHVTMHPGTNGGNLVTEVGDDCLIMVGAHIAHDCRIGNNVVMANNASLGGHVVIDDFAILGGMTAVHQFVRIGRHAMIGGASAVDADVIPYGSVSGDRARLMGLNLVGLKRRGFSNEEIHELQKAYRMLFAEEGTLQDRLDDLSKMYADNNLVSDVVGFARTESPRSICQPRTNRDG